MKTPYYHPIEKRFVTKQEWFNFIYSDNYFEDKAYEDQAHLAFANKHLKKWKIISYYLPMG